MNRRPLYIETKINCALDTLWAYTQDPSIHQQWDLRFSEISYLPKCHSEETQKFLYSTTIGFGIKVKGIGESVATKTKDNGKSTSVLKFSSDSKRSIIKQGSGYWKYIPEEDGIRFFTGYDYETRWGGFGKIFDKYIFRPLMVWATAWSFDCLRNWIEQGFHPRQALKAQFTVWISGLASGLIWIYQGLVPKLLFTNTGEIEILKQPGLIRGNEKTVLGLIGVAEIIFGFIILLFPKRSIHIINIVVLVLLTAIALISNSKIFTFPFNPFSLNLSMIALSIISVLNFVYLPKASNCITSQK